SVGLNSKTLPHCFTLKAFFIFKIDNVSYADILEILKIKKAFNVKQCGNVLEFKPTDEGYLKLHKTWFCKSKLCPVCNWRRAMKNSYQAQKVIEEVVKEKPKARW